MPDGTTTQWAIEVSSDTDEAVRAFLAGYGLREDELSSLIEDAVRWRMLDRTIEEARQAFADVPEEELQPLTDDAVMAVRQKKGHEKGR